MLCLGRMGSDLVFFGVFVSFKCVLIESGEFVRKRNDEIFGNMSGFGKYYIKWGDLGFRSEMRFRVGSIGVNF